ncbi:protease SohB [Catenovulum sp. SM1970]|uniref:protease SohB n=1 Tax=Marinifaba aquimaris TaxID=2741323 RepID=UPI00157429C8|nr:protease SohB [Marinifaba aquimaris]NTS76040.1 protease SohB [Marinifaba aquimaris]
MEFLYEYGLFLAKAITLVIAIIAVLTVIAANAMKQKGDKKGELTITNLTESFSDLKHHLQEELLSKEALKALEKKEKEQAKADKKAEKEKLKSKEKSGESDEDEASRLFVIDFNGSMDAHEAENLREEVNAVLSVINPQDEVLVRLESPGGVVHGYGLAASQLARFRERDIKLTAAVDKVAASGGYMMASVANTILAAPFSIIGSIGVIAQIPNFHRLLKKHDIDFEQMTAGEFKRTLTLFGENTDAGRDKFKEELEETHQLFKGHINQFRPELNLDKVATGEHWYGTQAKSLGLIDEVQTSDDFLMAKAEEKDVFLVKYQTKKTFAEKLPIAAAATIDNTLGRVMNRLDNLRHS